MRYFILGAAAIAAATLAPPVTAPARAEVTYPWCGKDRYGWGGCTFSTLEQCRAFIAAASPTRVTRQAPTISCRSVRAVDNTNRRAAADHHVFVPVVRRAGSLNEPIAPDPRGLQHA